MAEIYGMKVAKDLVHISGDTSDYHLEGFVAKPEHSRSNKHYISIFINGRYIKNFVLNKAILEGYHTLLTIGRFPICYINIQMDPILVDVNVHPTKLEVRLSKEDQLHRQIMKVRKFLMNYTITLMIVTYKVKKKYCLIWNKTHLTNMRYQISNQTILKEQ